jgi:hypothetical protein
MSSVHSARSFRLAVRLAPLGLLAFVACARSGAPPAPGEARGYVPELRGQRVMVLPFQLREGAVGDADAELAFALKGAGPSVEWILPGEIRESLRASPALDAPLEGLPVEVFLRTEVDRLGDPVFGVLRRLGAVTGADVALLPLAVFLRPAGEGMPSRVQVAAALMQVRTGRVLWYGVEAAPGGAGDPAALAAAMDALARKLAPRTAAVPGGARW